MTDCIFCDIVAGRAPASIVFQTDTSIAFEPLMPVTPGHTLIIPRDHADTIVDMSEDALAILMVDAARLTRTLMQDTAATGVNILHASGRDAQQSVMHVHLHLVPRRPGDGLDLWFRAEL